jgi:hypothetical protein
MRRYITPLERLEIEAKRLLRLVNEINTGRRTKKVIRIGPVTVREHVRRAHTRVCWRKNPNSKGIQVRITEATDYT